MILCINRILAYGFTSRAQPEAKARIVKVRSSPVKSCVLFREGSAAKGDRGRDPAAHGLSLIHRPDMASLSTGSTNFLTIVYENPAGLVLDLASKMKQFGIAPEIEIFDLSHIHGAKRLIDAGLMSPRPHIQFVMGVQNALPADVHLLDIILKETSITGRPPGSAGEAVKV